MPIRNNPKFDLIYENIHERLVHISLDPPTEYVGILKGTYLAHPSLLFLESIDKEIIPINMSYGNQMYRNFIENKYGNNDLFPKNTSSIKDKFFNPILISDPNIGNYYHFFYDFISKFKLIWMLKSFQNIILPQSAYKYDWQKSLILDHFSSGCLSKYLNQLNKKLFITDRYFYVQDPIIVSSNLSYSTFLFIKNIFKERAMAGSRNIYIKRNNDSNRSISENEYFINFLKRNNFDTIKMDGKLFLQVNRLNNAKNIIAAHGANLTNLTFLEGKFNLFEVTHRSHLGYEYEAIVSMVGSSYTNIESTCVDQFGNRILTPSQISDIENFI